MKKLFVYLLFLVFISCGNDTITNNCFTNFSFNETVNLNNAEFVNLQVPGGFSTSIIGSRSILIYRPTQSQYKAFDLECPEKNCATKMTFTNLRIICSCDNKEYNPLNGSPLDGDGCFVLEYAVNSIGNNILQISR